MKFFARNQIQEFSLPRTKLKTKNHQKNNRLCCGNNRLFIPVKIITTEIKEFKEERNALTVYTGSLLTQELHPVFHKPLGIHQVIKSRLHTHTTKKVTLIPSRNTLPLAQHTHTQRMLILTTSRAHNPSWIYHTRMYTNLQNELHYRIN